MDGAGLKNILQQLFSIVKKYPLEGYKKLRDFAHKRQIKHAPFVMEPSVPFHTLVKLADAEDITTEKKCALDVQLEINILTSKLESQDLSSEFMIQILQLYLHKQMIRIKSRNGNFRVTAFIVMNPSTLFDPVFQNNKKMRKEIGFLIVDLNRK